MIGAPSDHAGQYSQIILERMRTRIRSAGGYLSEKIIEYPPFSPDGSITWRVSLFYIKGPCTFSALYGIDARIAVINGELCLECGTGKAVQLDLHKPSFEFPSEFGAQVNVLTGSAVAIEVLTWRGQASSRISIVRPKRSVSILPNASVSVVIPIAPVVVRGACMEQVLGPRDALVMKSRTDQIKPYHFTGGPFALIEIFGLGSSNSQT